MMKEQYELHFREGFYETLVEVIVDGKIRKSLDLTTKLQLGLAEICKLSINPGQVVELRIGKGEAAKTLLLNPTQKFISIMKTETAVAVESMDESPGYV